METTAIYEQALRSIMQLSDYNSLLEEIATNALRENGGDLTDNDKNQLELFPEESPFWFIMDELKEYKEQAND